ncbi:MAG: hypothetical protein E6G85_11785 [Alphaproteobacteria bacterium]|nr:MAG: hypothetical protein E6G85_11785 [Alphaproteobacteria bacterium]
MDEYPYGAGNPEAFSQVRFPKYASGGERGSEILRLPHAKRLYFETQRPRCRFGRSVAQGHSKVVCVPQHGNLAQARKRILKDLQPLGRKLGSENYAFSVESERLLL